MPRHKKNIGCLEALILLPLLPIIMLVDYAAHYKPTPILGPRKRGKKKKWF